MAVLRIRKYGDPILRAKAEKIDRIDQEVIQLAENMIETLRSAEGIGLAANQVGVARRLIVVDLAHTNILENALAMVNPEVRSTSGEQIADEGCLSFPGMFQEVKRPGRAVVDFLDLKGEKSSREFEGLMARAVLHEIDHLNGVLFIDHLSALTRQLLKGRLRKFKEEAEAEALAEEGVAGGGR